MPAAVVVVLGVGSGSNLTNPAALQDPSDDPLYYSRSDLEHEGLRFRPASARPTRQMAGPDGLSPVIRDYEFACGERECVCRRALPCTARGDCMTLEENLEMFRAALAGEEGRVVTCDRAEVGRCGEFRYFYFSGDIYRDELRWFDAAGTLVAQTNTTDYAAYCNGASMFEWSGRVPRCDTPQREELICGRPGRPLRTPFETLRGITGASP